MKNLELVIVTKYLFPVMLQIIIIAMISGILRNRGIIIGYESVMERMVTYIPAVYGFVL